MDQTGVGGYEAKLMTPEYIQSSIKETVRNHAIPTFAQLQDDTWDFETRKGFQFSYLFVEFVLETYGIEAMNQLIRDPQHVERILNCSEAALHQQIVDSLQN